MRESRQDREGNGNFFSGHHFEVSFENQNLDKRSLRMAKRFPAKQQNGNHSQKWPKGQVKRQASFSKAVRYFPMECLPERKIGQTKKKGKSKTNPFDS